MRISEAIEIAEKSLERYQELLAQGKGKKMEMKINLCKDHLKRLNEMREGGLSPWHDYSDLVVIYEIENFMPKIINR